MSGPPPGAYLYSQLIYTPPYPTKKYTGRVVIITGANVGLGLETARHFVRLDAAKVILAVRNLEKGAAAKESILRSEKKTEDVVEVWKLDLSSFQSVKDFAKKAQNLKRIDILVENAGIVRHFSEYFPPFDTIFEVLKQSVGWDCGFTPQSYSRDKFIT
jgi:retinol dehydrogenase-12